MGRRILVIRPSGEVQFVYDDRLVGLEKAVGRLVRDQRASSVEPDQRRPGHWIVDLSRCGGPILRKHPDTGQPFLTRGDALRFEVEWLERNVLASPHGQHRL